MSLTTGVTAQVPLLAAVPDGEEGKEAKEWTSVNVKQRIRVISLPLELALPVHCSKNDKLIPSGTNSQQRGLSEGLDKSLPVKKLFEVLFVQSLWQIRG